LRLEAWKENNLDLLPAFVLKMSPLAMLWRATYSGTAVMIDADIVDAAAFYDAWNAMTQSR